MGGKTGTTTSSTTIPPEVLARYNAVNTQAQNTAATPFQQYSTDPNAFVAPLNEEQQAATGQTNQYANAAQPAIAYAQQGYTPEGFQQGVQGYMNPFLQNAMGATAAQMQNVNQQEQQKMLGSAIGQGAFGGDRSNIALGNLENQQNLAMGQTLGQMASQGFQNAAQNYQTGLGQIGNLGIQGQQAGLQGAQAEMGAGTLGQQTTQAGKSALYNQFQQQQAYPFQVAQFLANIAEGTGALSGSTTTQTAPQSFFSDVRLKEDIKRVGTAHNGLPIYTFKYKGDNTEQTHIGYMAQDVEKVHPEAVGESHGFKTVDYDKASEPAHKYAGGVVGNSEGGAVAPQHMGQGFAVGGDVVGPTDISALIAQQQQSFAPFQQAGIYGGQSGATPHGGVAGVVPAASMHVAKLQPAQISSTQNETFMGDLRDATNTADTFKKAAGYGKDFSDWAKTLSSSDRQSHAGQAGFASGGGVEPYATDDPMSQVVSDTEKDANRSLMKSPIVNQKGSSTFGDLMSLAAIPGEISTLGSGIGSVMTALAPIGLATGGVVGREHHDGSDGNVVGNPDDYTVNAAKELLRQREGLLTNAKYDTNAYRTGYGSDTITQPDGTIVPVKADTSITKDDAERDLARRTGITQQDIQSKIGADTWGKLTPDARVALTSTAYNYGSLPDSVAAATKSGNLSDIATAINNLGGANEGVNAVRRSKEASLIDPQGKYDPMAPQPKASSNNAPQSIGDFISKQAQNPDMLLSVLAGLGTMAGSNSRYLGAAILQGLGGGAEMYKGLQQQNIERQRVGIEQQGKGIEALKYLQGRYVPRYDATGRNIISYQDLTGGPDVSPADMGKINANAASGFNLPTGMTPSATQAPAVGVATQQPAAATKPEDDLAAINNVDYNDVGSLSKAAEAARRLAQGTADPTTKAAYIANADHFTTTAGNLATTGKETSYTIQADAQRDQLARAVDAQELKNNALAQRANMFGPDDKPLENAGPLGDQLNNLAGIAKQAGFSPETIKAILGFDPANGDTVNKLRDAIGAETGQLQDARAASALTRVFGGTPGNQIVPEASKWIIDNVIVPKADNEITTAKAIKNLDPRTDKITAKIMEEKTAHPWFKPGTAAAASEGTKAPAPAPAAPATEQPKVPLPLIGKPNIQRSQSTGNYFDGKQWYNTKGEKIEGNVKQ